MSTAEKLVHAFVTSRLDNCYSVLYGLPSNIMDKLQRVLNSAAHVVTLSKKRDHITPVLKDLHWLPINQRIVFKILLLVFKSLNGIAPSYMSEMIAIHKPKRCLRSSTQLLLDVKPYNMKTYGYRSFSVTVPLLWNSLLSSICDIPSLASLKNQVKTHLFKLAYP